MSGIYSSEIVQSSRKYSFISDLGQLTSNQITLERNVLWDVIKIEWEEVFLTLNGTIVTVAHISQDTT